MDLHEQSRLSLSEINFRLAALWALSEAGGGLLTTFKVPFLSLFIAAFAVLVVSLMAWHNASQLARPLLRAWAIVALVKLTFNPIGAPTAQLALAFQVLFALICFRYIRNFRTAAIVFGIGVMLETALQVLFLRKLKFEFLPKWTEFVHFNPLFFLEQMVMRQIESHWALMTLFVALCGAAGWWMGLFAAELPARVQSVEDWFEAHPTPPEPSPESPKKPKKKKKKVKKDDPRGDYWPFWIIIPGLILAIMGKFTSGLKIVQIGLVFLLVFTRFFQRIVLPLFQRWIFNLAADEETRLSETVHQLPQLGASARLAWQWSGHEEGKGNRIRQFLTMLFYFAIEKPEQMIAVESPSAAPLHEQTNQP